MVEDEWEAKHKAWRHSATKKTEKKMIPSLLFRQVSTDIGWMIRSPIRFIDVGTFNTLTSGFHIRYGMNLLRRVEDTDILHIFIYIYISYTHTFIYVYKKCIFYRDSRFSGMNRAGCISVEAHLPS